MADIPEHWPEDVRNAFWTAVNAPTYEASTLATLAFAQALAGMVRKKADDADIPGQRSFASGAHAAAGWVDRGMGDGGT